MRLQIEFPNHHPSLPYEIGTIYGAAKWVLQGIPKTLSTHASTSVTTTAPDASFVKTEQLGSFLSDFAKTIVDAMNSANRGRTYPTNPSGPTSGSRDQKCNFDGCDKFIRDCPAVEEYIKQGRCQ